jgi:hypothetical protein
MPALTLQGVVMKNRNIKRTYQQWRRQLRAERDCTIPVDAYLRQRAEPRGFEQYVEHYVLQQWLRGHKPKVI